MRIRCPKLSIILILALVLQLIPTSAIPIKAATSGSCGDNATWNLNGTTLTISGTGAMTSFSTSSSVPWRSSASKITAVNISSGITNIGSYAFDSCTALTEVSIPNTITSIGNYAFNKCVSLTSITIPNSVQTIGSSAFSGNSLLASISMGTGLTTIGNSAFYNAKSLTSITWGSNVTSIGIAAFYGASALTSITFNNKLATIGNSAFMHCSSLSSVSLPSSLTTIESGAFSYTRLTNVTIPASVTSISGNPFVGCSKLSTLNVANGNTKFAMLDNALYELSGSTPNGVISYLITSNQTSFDVRSGTKIIYENAFSFCDCLTTITLPDTLTTIQEDAFTQCNALKSLDIPDGVKTVGQNCFSFLPSLTSISLGAGFPTGETIFFGCTALESITVSEENKKIVAVDNVIYNAAMTTLQYYAPARAGKEYHVADTVTNLSINAIYGSLHLKDLYLPKTLTEIGYQGICENKKLNSVFFAGNAPDYYVSSYEPIVSSLDNLLIYRTEDSTGWDGKYWKDWDYTYAYWDPENTNVYNGTWEDISWKVEEGIRRLTLTGNTVALSDFATNENTPWYRSHDVLQTIEMEGIASLGSYAFSDMAKLLRVEADEDLTTIGNYSFQNCSSLKFFDDMDILTSIGTAAFSGNSALQEDLCFRGITSLGEEAFRDCISLKMVYFGNKLTKLFPNTFAGCTSLTHVILPESLTQIQTSAFQGCSSLRTINIPASVSQIGATAFGDTDSLTNVYFYGAVPTTWKTDSFSNAHTDLTLYYRAKDTENADSWNALDGTWNSIPVVGLERFYTERCDTYSFENTASSFGYGNNYRIPVERYREVLDIITAHYYYAINRSWGGNCFGMSSSSLAFYEEDEVLVDYEEDIETLYQMSAPQDTSSALTKLIEAYQIAQFHPEIAGLRGDICTYYNDYRNIIHLVEEFERSGGFRVDSQATPVVLGLYSLFGGHAVVPTSVEQDDNGDYILTIYDSNYPSQLQTMKIYRDFSGISYLWYVSASCITYSTVANIFGSPSAQSIEDNSLYLSVDKEEATVETTTSEGVQTNGDIEGGYEQKIFSDNTEETFSGIRSFVMPEGEYRLYDNSGQETSEDAEKENITFYLASSEHFVELKTSDEDAHLDISRSSNSGEPLVLSLDSDETDITNNISILNSEGDTTELEITGSAATIQVDNSDDSIAIDVDNAKKATVTKNGAPVRLTEDGHADVNFKEITPTAAPTTTPVIVPTMTPTAAPVITPTAAPTTTPVIVPTMTPTAAPVIIPTAAPSAAPVIIPTPAPTLAPVIVPTAAPSAAPVITPTAAPVIVPTVAPTTAPTITPTAAPTTAPVIVPTVAPTAAPTITPGNVLDIFPPITPVVTPTPTASATPMETLAPISADAYAKNSSRLSQNTTVKWNGILLQIDWASVVGADGYDIELTSKKKGATPCITTITSADQTSIALDTYNHKGFDPKSTYEVVVKAYRLLGDEKEYVAQSTKCYIVGANHKKYTNVKKLKPKKKTVTCKRKKKIKLAIKIVKTKKKKKLLPKSYGPTLRYYSSNPNIATVTKKGVIKGKKKGSCYIYVRGLNGVGCRVKVTVK